MMLPTMWILDARLGQILLSLVVWRTIQHLLQAISFIWQTVLRFRTWWFYAWFFHWISCVLFESRQVCSLRVKGQYCLEPKAHSNNRQIPHQLRRYPINTQLISRSNSLSITSLHVPQMISGKTALPTSWSRLFEITFFEAWMYLSRSALLRKMG
jgi:hypothetical protein